VAAGAPPPSFLGFDSYQTSLNDLLIPWSPIALLLVIGYFMWRTLKLMPRTKPQEISAKSKSSVTWAEVEGCRSAADLRFLAAEVLARIEKHGDLFDGLLTARSALP